MIVFCAFGLVDETNVRKRIKNKNEHVKRKLATYHPPKLSHWN